MKTSVEGKEEGRGAEGRGRKPWVRVRRVASKGAAVDGMILRRLTVSRVTSSHLNCSFLFKLARYLMITQCGAVQRGFAEETIRVVVTDCTFHACYELDNVAAAASTGAGQVLPQDVDWSSSRHHWQDRSRSKSGWKRGPTRRDVAEALHALSGAVRSCNSNQP